MSGGTGRTLLLLWALACPLASSVALAADGPSVTLAKADKATGKSPTKGKAKAKANANKANKANKAKAGAKAKHQAKTKAKTQVTEDDSNQQASHPSRAPVYFALFSAFLATGAVLGAAQFTNPPPGKATATPTTSTSPSSSLAAPKSSIQDAA